jgi:hypothetical protein
MMEVEMVRMSTPRRNRLTAGLLALALTLAPHGALGQRTDAPLDEGRLDPAWFGVGLEFRNAGEIDYLWVRPGCELDGRKLRFVPFGKVEFLGENATKRKPQTRERAEALSPILHEHLADRFRNAFEKRISIVAADEDLRVEGRVVDASSGFITVTYVGVSHCIPLTVDLRFVDAATGELLAAIHHRAVEDDWDEWLEDIVEEIADTGLAKLYGKGRRATE